ncbi:MAG: hypothetical protein [Microvirus sp.]|nr:MAG: hypothetical protein [Microvirus sp.]
MKYNTIIKNIDADTGELLTLIKIKEHDYIKQKEETDWAILGDWTTKKITKHWKLSGQTSFDWYR